ncbi:MAG TPA: hypothetical protein VIJ38_13615 [Acidobacteriaceae bacterium]
MNEHYSQPKPPPTQAEFPNGNAKDDKVYQMANPAAPLQQLAIMSMEGYMRYGTLLQSMRQVGTIQDKRIHELLNQLSVCQDQLRDAQERLENLRNVRRKEMRPRVEAGLAASSGSAGYFSSSKE